MEWKKLKVLLKEKLNDERLQFIKYEDTQIKKAVLDLAIQKHVERDRIIKTMSRLKNTDFHNMKTKEYIKEQVPDIDVENIFKPKIKVKKDDDSM